MRYTPYLLLLAFFLVVTSCTKEDDLSPAELQRQIQGLKERIDEIIAASTGETSEDCRTVYIPGGNHCGPIYVYGVGGIDTLELEGLFKELSHAQTELYALEGGPACDLASPAKDSLINGKCTACFGSEGNFECN